jgi:hypothetical protein
MDYLVNLFVVSPFVVAEESDGLDAVEVAEEGMLQDDLGEARVAVKVADGFERVSLAIEVFDDGLFAGRVERLDALWRAHPTDAAADEQPVGNQSIEPSHAPRRLRELLLQLLHDALLDEAEMMHDLGHAPPAGRGAAREIFGVKPFDCCQQLAMHTVELPVYFFHQLCSSAIMAAGCQ